MEMFTLATAIWASAATPAAVTAPPVPCTAAQFSQMDFWVGDWQIKWDGGAGTDHVAKSYDGCVVEEHFNGQPSVHLQGQSVSTFSSGEWRQNWVDNEGSYFDLKGGMQPDGSFVLENVRTDGTMPYRRMVFENITPDSLTWHWQGSDDAGKTWADRWVIEYTRVKP